MSLATTCAHLGSPPSGAAPAGLQSAIEQSSLFRLGSPDEADRILADYATGTGYVYTRFGNPTVDQLAEAISMLEGGAGCFVTSSGNAALLTALSIALDGRPLRKIITHYGLYGGSVELLGIFRDTYGVEVVWADPDDDGWIEAMVGASVVLVETPSNPLWKLVDLRATIESAHASGATVIVDNTVATPFNQQPLALGADWVVHSTSKFLNGHSDAIGGAVIARKPPTARHRAIHRNLGATVNALDAWLILRGIRTFALRMEAHNHNGAAVAEWLRSRKEVRRVYFPGAGSERAEQIQRAQMTNRGSMVSFELEGGAEAARRFLGRLRLIIHGVSLGGIESLAVQPASTSHRGMSKTEMAAAGVSPALVRLSVGTEDIDDILADLEGALRQ